MSGGGEHGDVRLHRRALSAQTIRTRSAGRRAGAASRAHAARSWQTLHSFCCFPSRHIYLCNVTRSREGGRLRGGEEERNCFTGCPPLRTRCYHTKDVSKASALPLHRSKCCTRTHTHVHSTQRTTAEGRTVFGKEKVYN